MRKPKMLREAEIAFRKEQIKFEMEIYDSKCVECKEPLEAIMWERGYCYNCREPLEKGPPNLELIQGGKKETKLK